MALNWEWSKKVGYCEMTQVFDGEPPRRYTLSLYEGNALLIMLHEFQNEKGEDCWNMVSFWADESHAKNCLGLSKDSGGNMYETYYMKLDNFVFFRKGFRQFNTVIKLITKAFDDVNIRVKECEA